MHETDTEIMWALKSIVIYIYTCIVVLFYYITCSYIDSVLSSVAIYSGL